MQSTIQKNANNRCKSITVMEIRRLECINCGCEQMYIRKPSYTHRDKAFVNCFNCYKDFYIHIPNHIPEQQILRYLHAKV